MSEFHYGIDTRKNAHRMISVCAKLGVKINLSNPVTIQDKIAWLNIYEEDPLKTLCADKIRLHEYSIEKLGKDICIPILKVYDNPNEIHPSELPDKFVLKCNHGSGMNIIVKDKKTFNLSVAIKQLNKWLQVDYAFYNGLESHYHDIKRKAFAEEYKEDKSDGLIDYKFLCFNGKPKLMQLYSDRFNSNRHMSYYDMDFNLLKYERTDFKSGRDIVHERPTYMDTMIEYAEKLSEPFKFVRVDFYETDNRVYLGEMTFTPYECAFKYRNRDDAIEIGKMLEL